MYNRHTLMLMHKTSPITRFAAPVGLLIVAGITVRVVAGTGLVVVAIVKTVPNTDSVKVTFAPVAGAADYRIYEEGRPDYVKYAGRVHRPNPAVPGKMFTTPATQIEWNGLVPGKQTRLIIEAVDTLGPTPLVNRLIEDDSSAVLAAAPAPIAVCTGENGAMVGSNSGPTPDGKTSINGQGDPANRPKVIARSQPFTVTATGKAILPSQKSAKQVVFDTFETGEITANDNGKQSVDGRQYNLHTPQADWDIVFQGSDLARSQPFVMDRHFMDVLFDGRSGDKAHLGRSASALSPRQTADFSGGRTLHLTMEMDGHLDGHRWAGFNLTPEGDPLTDFYWTHRARPVNRRNQSFFCEITDTRVILGLIDGAAQSTSAATVGLNITQRDVRSAKIYPRRVNGHGLDNRSRFDLYLRRDHYTLCEDGVKIADGTIADGLPFEQAKVYFSHFLYHSSDELFVLRNGAPHESYWIEQFPYSDERHWDNIGFEVLPGEVSL